MKEPTEQKKQQKRTKKNQPRAIICCVLNYKDKGNILKNCEKLKRSNIYVNEDFSQETLREKEDKVAYLNYRLIVVRGKDIEI